ncbi:MAG: hypothetical protein AB7O29_13265 [Acidimicrobiia bacterium]
MTTTTTTTTTRPAPTVLTVDVTEAAAVGGPAHTVATVHLPDPDRLADPPVVCFGFPGAGYARGYYSFDLPGASGGGQAGHHVDRGWIFVACDHLGVGDSTPEGETPLTYEILARANKATVEAVLAHLAAGTVADGFPPVERPVTLGLGQSMGGCLTIVAQGQHHLFDGVGILGFSAVRTFVPTPPGEPDNPMPWMPRGSTLAQPIVVNAAALAALAPPVDGAGSGMGWAFHWDDEPEEVVRADMAPEPGAPLPVWRSAFVPSCAICMEAPGTVATEAAAIEVPVRLARGVRDVVPDPWLVPKQFWRATDLSLCVCPR